MNSDGQVYADFDGTAPELDKQRFLIEEGQAFIAQREAKIILSQMEELERMLNAEGR